MTNKQLARILICVFVAFWVASGVILALYDFGFFGCVYEVSKHGNLEYVKGKARGNYTFPTEVDGIKVTDLVGTHFGFDHIKWGVAQNRVTAITIPDGISKAVEAIGKCKNLKALYIGSDVENFFPYGFYSEQLECIWVNERNPYYHIENNCLIESERNELILAPNYATIPDGVIIIGAYAFSGRKMNEDLIIPNSVKYIAEYAISSCEGLKNVYIPQSVEGILYNAFFDLPKEVHFWFEADNLEDVKGIWIANYFPEDRLHFGVEMPK